MTIEDYLIQCNSMLADVRKIQRRNKFELYLWYAVTLFNLSLLVKWAAKGETEIAVLYLLLGCWSVYWISECRQNIQKCQDFIKRLNEIISDLLVFQVTYSLRMWAKKKGVL